MVADPQISVVVPSHDRPQLLARLLDALAAQSLSRDRWEAVVVHDCGPDGTEDLLRAHPLAAAGVLQHRSLPVGTGPPARMRNAGWRMARAPIVAFTDDDCRPDPHWVRTALALATEHPWTIVQGRTEPDAPDPSRPRQGSLRRTIDVTPPTKEAQTCNIVYPRGLLEATGGFDEGFRQWGDDVDLAYRAKSVGAGHLGAAGLVVRHATEFPALRARVRDARRLGELAEVVRRHPDYRYAPYHPLGLFARPSHARLVLALAALAAAPRRPAMALLALPYAQLVGSYVARSPDRRLCRAGALSLLTAAEVVHAARGSVRSRSLYL
ncbi:MAG TPA: glycosyltransferase [Solirubrobacteraceae bacterium]|jgi:glycosyltransferase involved in cell wall biosynthesis|nr:glycosyltransferase [Solirubrobacteraceae bacterium]